MMEQSSDALLYAIMSKNLAQVESLVNCGVKVLPADSWIIYEACLEGPPMIDAISSNAEIDLNPLIPGQHGDRVLHHLLRTPSSRFKFDKFHTMKCLFQKGVCPTMPDRKGNTALHILAQDPLGFELLGFLLSDNSALPPRTKSSILASIDCKNQIDGNTALLVATQHRREINVRLLLEKGSNPHIRGEFGRTALYFAVARDCVEIARLLLHRGASKGLDTVALSRDMEEVLDENPVFDIE